MECRELINKIVEEGVSQIKGNLECKFRKICKNEIGDLKFLPKELSKEEGFTNYAGGTPFVDQHLYRLDTIIIYGKFFVDWHQAHHRLLLSYELLSEYLKQKRFVVRKEELTLYKDKSKNILISIKDLHPEQFHTLDYRPYVEVAVGRKFKKRNLKNGGVILTPCPKNSLDKVLNDLLNVNLNPFAKISSTENGFKLEFLRNPVEYTIYGM